MSIEAENGKDILSPRLQLVAWEITRTCNLLCAHCRASAGYRQYSGELSTEECFRLVDGILEVGKPIIILTGGEPLARPDVFDIGKYAVSKGLRVVMGSNGTLITEETAAKLKEIPLSRLGVSLDFPRPELQDNFRGQHGAFDALMNGVDHARKAGIEIQINTTVTKLNAPYLDELLSLVLGLGAVAFHPFMLVPTGRGKGLESVELTPEEYEKTMNWIYDRQVELGDRIFFKPTDVPHYVRIMKQREKQGHALTASRPLATGHNPANVITRGCLAGVGFCFVSHVGNVQGCGYFTKPAGNIREQSFRDVWFDSPLFRDLRDLSHLKGKCGACEYKKICGGCRARAYEGTGDYLESEPYCVYEPVAWRRELARIDD